MKKEDVAGIIDHTQLKATATKTDIARLCAEAIEHNFASVCINPVWIEYAASLLKGCRTEVCTVVGFPLGASKSSVKAFAASQAVLDGAGEVDMVINIGAAKEGLFDLVENDIKEVVLASSGAGKEMGKKIIVKVILETCYLTDDEVVKVCQAAKKAGADFVKTSTGFGTPKDSSGKPLPNGATVHHVELMRKTVGAEMGVKASGGIHTAEEAKTFILAGANRLGVSAGVQIINGWKE